MSEPNRILEASARVAERLAVLNDDALRRLVVATSLDGSIVRLYQHYRMAAFHAGLITADEALTICNSLNPVGLQGGDRLAAADRYCGDYGDRRTGSQAMTRLRTRLQLAMRRLPVQVMAFSVLALLVAILIHWPQIGLFVLAWVLVGLVVALALVGRRRS